MKTFVKVILIFSLLITDLFAFFGGGMSSVVSDPTSYTYYAKQIKAMNDQMKSALDQLDVLRKANNLIDETNKLVFESGEKIYNPTKQIKNLIRNVQNTQERFKSLANRASKMGAERFLKDYHHIDEPLENEAYEKWKGKLDALFDNSQDETYQELKEKLVKAQKSKNYLKYQQAVNNLSEYLRLKQLEQNAITKASLRAPIDLYQEYFMNDEIVKRRKFRKETISDLTDQINSSTDMIKQQQTTNQILLLLLETIDSQYQMQMRYQYAMSIPQLKAQSTSIKTDLEQLKQDKENFTKAHNAQESNAMKEKRRFLEEKANQGKNSQIYRILSGQENFSEDYNY